MVKNDMVLVVYYGKVVLRINLAIYPINGSIMVSFVIATICENHYHYHDHVFNYDDPNSGNVSADYYSFSITACNHVSPIAIMETI